MKRIALAQMNIEYGNFEKNVSVIEEYLSAAIEQKCDVILIPELCSSGFDLHHLSDYPAKNVQLYKKLQTRSEYQSEDRSSLKKGKTSTTPFDFFNPKRPRRFITKTTFSL